MISSNFNQSDLQKSHLPIAFEQALLVADLDEGFGEAMNYAANLERFRLNMNHLTCFSRLLTRHALRRGLYTISEA